MDRIKDIPTLFKFFTIFDSKEAFFELKKELVLEAFTEFGNFVKGFSFAEGIVKVEYFDHEEGEFGISQYDVYNDIFMLINKNVRDIKRQIDIMISTLLNSGSDIMTHLSNLNTLLIALDKRKFLPFSGKELLYESFADIAEHLRINYGFESGYNYGKKPYLVNIENHHPLSYKWKSISDEVGLLSLRKFYKLLSEEPKIVECSEADFLNAFTQAKVTNGIRWCVMGKNGQYSKQTLIRFIDYLIEYQYIEDKTADYNKAIRYVFRTNTGQTIKHLSVSKSSSTSVPSEWMRLLAILEKI